MNTTPSLRQYTHLLSVLLVGLSFFWLTACADAPSVGPGDPGNDDVEVTIDGTATQDSGYGEQPASGSEATPASSHHAGVSGAAVTAASVSSDGSTSAIAGEAETDAEGSYSLGLEGSSTVMTVTASEAEYDGTALVRYTGATTIQAMPITVESSVESDTYVESKQRDDDEIRAADVALYVDQSLATDVDAGNSSTANVAASVHDAVVAEFEARNQTGDSPPNDEVQEEKENAFIDLQADLAVATSSQAEAEAIHEFEETLALLDVELGGSAQTQAQTRQTSSAAAIHADVDLSSEADLALRKQAETIAAIATAYAIATTVETQGLSGEASAIEDSGETLIADIRAAGSHDAIDSAKAEFEATTTALLAAGLDVNESEIDQVQAIMSTVVAELRNEIAGAGSAQAIASAYSTFYAEARALADASGNVIPGGASTADVLITLAAFESIH